MNAKLSLISITFFLFCNACSAPKKNLTNIEVRPFEGDIYYKYFNDSLGLTLSLGGGVEIVKKPSVDSIKKALATSFVYNISDSKMKFVDNVLYAKDHFNDDIEYDLIQVYKVKKNQTVESILQNLKIEKTIPVKNVCFKQDSFRRAEFNGKKMYAVKYSIAVGNRFTQVAQCFFAQRGYVLRFLTFGKNLLVCDKDARNFTDSFELSTIKDIDRSKMDAFSAMYSYYQTKNNYLEPLHQLNILSEAEKKEISYKADAATFYSFIGDNKNAIKYRASAFGKMNSNLDSNLILKFKPENALNIVNYIPDSCRVVMINENHYYGYPRKFMGDLLKPFYDKGFSYFAAETFTDDSINEIKQSIGYYTRDPNYGNTVKKALKLGYHLVAYENRLPFDSTLHLNNMEFREYNQALNLKKALEKYPKSKFIVFVGMGHHYKTHRNGDIKLMGEFFKEITGITPFCIDQFPMAELDPQEYEMPEYNYVQNKYHFKESIFLRNANSFFVDESSIGRIDVQIFHPRTTYDANGYATWLLDKGDIKKTFAFNDPKYVGTIFQIYEYFEFGRLPFGDAIPILNLPLDGKNTFDIKLERGNYYAKVYDRFRNELYTEIFILK